MLHTAVFDESNPKIFDILFVCLDKYGAFMDRHHNDDEKNIYNTSYQNAHGGRRGKIDPFSHLHNQRRIYDIARATEIDYQIFIKPYSNDHLSII